jgi:hypothetical protein
MLANERISFRFQGAQPAQPIGLIQFTTVYQASNGTRRVRVTTVARKCVALAINVARAHGLRLLGERRRGVKQVYNSVLNLIWVLSNTPKRYKMTELLHPFDYFSLKYPT